MLLGQYVLKLVPCEQKYET